MREYVALARKYEDAVISGEIPACKWVRLACERNRRDCQRAERHDPAFPYRFDLGAAAKICAAAEMLPHVKGPKAKRTGKTFLGSDGKHHALWATIELEPWQCWLLTTLFGWLRTADGLRRFRVGFPLVPRKNAKSTVAAIIVLFMLTSDGESGAECYSLATTREQAKAVAEIAWEMAKRSRQFCEYFGVRIGSETTKTLFVPSTASKFAPLSSDANSLDGLNVSLGVIDELHAHKTRAVYDVIDTATGARPQPLIFPISTAGVDLGGICYEKLTYLKKVLEGTLVDEALFGIYYTIDEDDDWRTEAAQRKANPNWGVSVRPDDLERKTREAEQTQAGINNFLTKHCNVWAREESTYVPIRELMALGNPTLKMEDFIEAPCWIGVDLAEIRDIAALVALFRPDPKTYVAFGKFYLPEKAVARSPIAQMSGWVKGGHIIETDGDQADYLRIEDDIVAWCDLLHDVREIDFDRALAAQMGQSLKRRFIPAMGKDAVERFVITVNQNVETMNPAMQMINGLILSKQFAHEGNPGFNWMMSNVVVELNHKGEVYPRKAGGKDSPNKIDGAVALYTCFSRASQAVITPPTKRRKARVWTPQGFVPVVPDSTPAGGGQLQPSR